MNPSPKPSFPPFASVLLPFILLGCSVPRPQRGGHAATTPSAATGISQSLVQGDNPSQPSRQDQDTIHTRTYTLPPRTQPPAPAADNQKSKIKNQKFILPAPVTVTDRSEAHARTELGAAQKDTARELAAKLSSLKGIVWVGVALFLFGVASLFWPPLQTVIGSVTTSAAITLGSLALMVLPTLIVGNELLILAGVAITVGAWFLAHRHGQLRGLLYSSSSTAPESKIANQKSKIPPPLSMAPGN
jgi:hypothetical protein